MTRARNAALTLTLLIGLVMATPAQAAPLNLVGGTAGQLPGGSGFNDFVAVLFPGPQIGGYYGSQITFDLPPLSQLLFEFYGGEAGFHNEFTFSGTELFDHPSGGQMAVSLLAPLASVLVSLVGTGTLPFSFEANMGGVVVPLANGGNPNDSGGAATGPNFFASCNPFGSAAGSGGPGCNMLYLFFDDGGAGPDDDHDDFLVRISALTPATPAQTPEPATLGLLGLGLLLVARRFRR
jgi:PEP-CTERM motif-containing protein